jgi:endonuclease III
VQVLLTCLAGKDTPLLVHPSAIRTLTRIGLMDRVHSDGAARKALEKLLDPEDLYNFQLLLTQHGEDICRAPSPRCFECVVVDLCKFKRKVGVSGAAAGEKA